MDPDNKPDWSVMREAMIECYLPPDHTMRLKIKFQTTIQCTTLLEFVERFQVLDSALLFAKMIINYMRKVLVKGMAKVEDLLFILEHLPPGQDLNHWQAYEAASLGGGVAVYSSTVTARSSPRVCSLQVGYSFTQYLRLRYCFAVCGGELLLPTVTVVPLRSWKPELGNTTTVENSDS
eukprot:1541309-Rhodomonas_salina.4